MDVVSCKCGRWYNTSVKCPNCGTVADKKYTVEFVRKEKLEKELED